MKPRSLLLYGHRPRVRLVSSFVGSIIFLVGLGMFDLDARSHGEVLKFEITERQAFAGGQSFGDTGPYEMLVGRVQYAIDPKSLHNQGIVDLELSPRDADGRVRFDADLCMLVPRDLAKGNGAILYDVNNRGNKVALRYFNDASGGNAADDAGNGFLMRQGFTIVWSGWDGELLPGGQRLQLRAPVAMGAADAPVRGRVRYELTTTDTLTRQNVAGGNHGAYWPTELGMETASLSWRLRVDDPRIPIPTDQFQLDVTPPDSATDGSSQLPTVELELAAGFRRGYLYELIYEARDPLVHGTCFAAVRDLVSALKHGYGDENPCTPPGRLERAYGFGVSQSGRFLREMLYSDFNQDERGQIVFDGLNPHVAGGGLGSFNHRFAQPTAYATQHQYRDWGTDRFPFTYGKSVDPWMQRTDGLLARAESRGLAPKIIHTQTSTEYWSRSGSLVHTDPEGKHDADLPDNVRIYAYGGSQHGFGSYPPRQDGGQSASNTADYRPLLRANLVALDQWCRQGTLPPANRYPTISSHSLVDWQQSATDFPTIPNVRYPEVINQPDCLDFGPNWYDQRVATQLPPISLGTYAVLVPKCGPDGNELGCLLPAEVAVPLATFTGWNLRTAASGPENALTGLSGSYIPLPVSLSEQQQFGDPRRSLEERYRSFASYLDLLESYCRTMVESRYLLAEDVSRILDRQREFAQPQFVAFDEALSKIEE